MSQKFCADANNLGAHVVPSHTEFHKFQSLPAEKQSEILKAFKIFYQVISSAQSKGADLRESRSTVWWAIKELGLCPPSDLFDQLEEDDYFEIYDPDYIQIYRSFNFFNLTTYSIEDIFSYSWLDLYSRSEFITKGMIEMGGKIMSGEIGTTVRTNFPMHAVVDKFSPGKDWSLIRHKLFAPLRSNSNEPYLFNVFKVVEKKAMEKPW